MDCVTFHIELFIMAAYSMLHSAVAQKNKKFGTKLHLLLKEALISPINMN